MTQLVARVDDSLVAAIDDLVAAGAVASRSDAMRIGLEALVNKHRKHVEAERVAEAYKRHPQTAEELAGVDAGTRALIEEEPW
jgi:Arc/MetJ-type ribon-helix-helix transcriptional regulator